MVVSSARNVDINKTAVRSTSQHTQKEIAAQLEE
jgi:hypothetical protein